MNIIVNKWELEEISKGYNSCVYDLTEEQVETVLNYFEKNNPDGILITDVIEIFEDEDYIATEILGYDSYEQLYNDNNQ